MPHITIEFSEGIASDAQIESLLDALHASIAATGLFEAGHIRLRAYPMHHHRCGGAKTHFIHVQCRIHAGRSEQQKKELSGTIMVVLREQQWALEAITVEVVEMARESYSKYYSH